MHIPGWILQGWWPGILGDGSKDARQFIADYGSLIAEVDIQNVSGMKRDPLKVMYLLQSYARHISTRASLSTLVRNMNGTDRYLREETASSYIADLERLKVVEQLPAWSTHVRISLRYTKK